MRLRHKGVLIILDGLGDRPIPQLEGATPLEAARTPHMDRLIAAGQGGLVDPLLPGVPVSTHTGTGVLMGLSTADALRLARGPVEAVGVGVPMGVGDIALRCNFATLRPDTAGFEVLDRRAGRINDGASALAQSLGEIALGDGIMGRLRPATQHRAVLHLSGEGLSAEISDTDPGGGEPPLRVQYCHALRPDDPDAERTAAAVNLFVQEAHRRLQGHSVNRNRVSLGLPPANGVITRGAGQLNGYRNLLTHMGVRTALVAAERTVVGLGRLFDFRVYNSPAFTSLPDTDLEAKFDAVRTALADHHLVILHIKGTDICGHDREPLAKRAFLERIDGALAPLLSDGLAIAITGDHSTDSNIGRHCGDPVPSLLFAPGGRRDTVIRFGEGPCCQGGLGRIPANRFLDSLLDNMGCLPNYRPADRDFY
jgi:2,3-bisphosphoglycerate-independent phosphoglycerate mutase